jgi:predicted GIY-YIG superfamily endonuclease
MAISNEPKYRRKVLLYSGIFSYEGYIDYVKLDNCVMTTDNKMVYTGDKSYFCYILQSTTSNKTYVGMTDNIQHRLRQHNGEIIGGAKYTTAGRPWQIVCYVGGFTTRNEALRFEWRMHHWKINKKFNGQVSLKGLNRRYQLLEILINSGKWRKDQPIQNNLLTIFWHRNHTIQIADTICHQYHKYN